MSEAAATATPTKSVMKPVDFKPEGRKLTEFAWQSDAVTRDPNNKNVLVGPRAVVVVRFMEDKTIFNGRVDRTTVYAEGDSVKEVRDECFRQLETLHAIEWTEHLWVRFHPEALFHTPHRKPFTAHKVRTAVTPHGDVWQWFGRPGYADKKSPPEWQATRLGAPPVGVVEGKGSDENYTAKLIPPDDDVAAAVAELSARWTAVLSRMADLFGVLFVVPDAIDTLKTGRAGLVDSIVDKALAPRRTASESPTGESC